MNYTKCDGGDCENCLRGYLCFSGRVYPEDWFENCLTCGGKFYVRPLKPVQVDKYDSRYDRIEALGMVESTDNVSKMIETASQLRGYMKVGNVNINNLPDYNQVVANALIMFPEAIDMLKLRKFVGTCIKEDHERLVECTKNCRNDMHSPDNQGISAVVTGINLDNSFGGSDPTKTQLEMMVGLKNEDNSHIEWFNLANLIAMARMANLVGVQHANKI
jgi:hypothetical protein